jgi:Mrp family chromosome partitioning ATPase
MSGAATVAEELRDEAASCEASARDEQIEALVEQLFFRTDAGPVRYVGFAASESSTETAALCLAVARTLAEDGRFDIGLVDASPGTLPLHTRLEIAPTPHAESSWPLGPRLWLVPCQTWLPAGNHQRIPEHSLSRLRELTREFDFAVVHCPAVSWLTFRIGQACDGIVLVLTANQTRRVVAAQMKDQLQKAQVPLLGTVLTERRLPVPEGLYRKL